MNSKKGLCVQTMENMGEDWKVYVNEQNEGGQGKEKRTALCSD